MHTTITFMAHQIHNVDNTFGVPQWLERRSLTGRTFTDLRLSMVDTWPLHGL